MHESNVIAKRAIRRFTDLSVPGAGTSGTVLLLPGAGAGAAAGLRWLQKFNDSWLRYSVQYPARGDRMMEKGVASIEDLAKDVAADLQADMPRPLVLIGHSMGAWVAQSVCVNSCWPSLLVCIASAPPSPLANPEPWHRAPDEILLEELQRRSSSSTIDHRMMRLFLPIFRRDIALGASYVTRGDIPAVDCPILAIAGRRDELAGAASMVHWRHHTRGGFRLLIEDGDHYVAPENLQEIVEGLL